MVTTEDKQSICDANFAYAEQRVKAVSYFKIRLNELAAPTTPSRAHWIFSPGRTGSTLLATYIRATGANVLSECDVHTDLVQKWPAPRNPQSIAKQINSLFYPAADEVYVKLRAQCANEPKKLISGGDNVTYLWRGAESWYRSQARLFGGNPERLASFLAKAIRLRLELEESGQPVKDLFYEDLLHDPDSTLNRLDIDLGGMFHIANDQDVQENTPVSRSNENFPVTAKAIEQFSKFFELNIDSLSRSLPRAKWLYEKLTP